MCEIALFLPDKTSLPRAVRLIPSWAGPLRVAETARALHQDVIFTRPLSFLSFSLLHHRRSLQDDGLILLQIYEMLCSGGAVAVAVMRFFTRSRPSPHALGGIIFFSSLPRCRWRILSSIASPLSLSPSCIWCSDTRCSQTDYNSSNERLEVFALIVNPGTKKDFRRSSSSIQQDSEHYDTAPSRRRHTPNHRFHFLYILPTTTATSI